LLDLGFPLFCYESRVSNLCEFDFGIDVSFQGRSLDRFGRRWRIMYGFGGEKWKHNRHMWPVVTSNATTVVTVSSPSQFICKVYQLFSTKAFFFMPNFLLCLCFFLFQISTCCSIEFFLERVLQFN
jgi:hypothetical protein